MGGWRGGRCHLDQILLFVIELEHVVQCDRVRELALACYPGVEQCLLRAEAIYIGNRASLQEEILCLLIHVFREVPDNLLQLFDVRLFCFVLVALQWVPVHR